MLHHRRCGGRPAAFVLATVFALLAGCTPARSSNDQPLPMELPSLLHGSWTTVAVFVDPQHPSAGVIELSHPERYADRVTADRIVRRGHSAELIIVTAIRTYPTGIVVDFSIVSDARSTFTVLRRFDDVRAYLLVRDPVTSVIRAASTIVIEPAAAAEPEPSAPPPIPPPAIGDGEPWQA